MDLQWKILLVRGRQNHRPDNRSIAVLLICEVVSVLLNLPERAQVRGELL